MNRDWASGFMDINESDWAVLDINESSLVGSGYNESDWASGFMNIQ